MPVTSQPEDLDRARAAIAQLRTLEPLLPFMFSCMPQAMAADLRTLFYRITALSATPTDTELLGILHEFLNFDARYGGLLPTEER